MSELRRTPTPFPLPRVARELDDEHLDTESLEQLVLVCLEGLANLAQRSGQRRRAARLHDAAAILWRGHEAANTSELTAREWDVASLVARGFTNRLIAQELVLSERTVDTHVSHILGKLTLVSRVQIAAWVVGRRRGGFAVVSAEC
jgi:DNA-binding NarL/FixJ family response regulator